MSGKVFGQPLLDDRMTKSTFSPIVEKVQSRFSGWKASSLSLAGTATLIKAVTSGIPNHSMQINLLPSTTLDSLDKAKMGVLWGSTNGLRKIHLVSWEQVCHDRRDGGIGIQPSKHHNMALIMKLL